MKIKLIAVITAALSFVTSIGTLRAEQKAAPQGVPFSCLPLIEHSLSIEVSKDFIITGELAHAIYGFNSSFLSGPTVAHLPEDRREVCRHQAVEVFTRLVTLASQRLLTVIREQKDLEKYYREFNTFLNPWDKAQRATLAQNDLFREAHIEYSKLLRQALNTELRAMKDSRWRSYADISVDLVAWTTQWTENLGQNEPASVNFLNREVAVQSHVHDAATMKILLFHELAHLNDPNLPTFLRASENLTYKQLYQNELYAWQRTFEFLDARASEGIAVPDHFKYQVLPVKNFLGLNDWVRAIVFSRHH